MNFLKDDSSSEDDIKLPNTTKQFSAKKIDLPMTDGLVKVGTIVKDTGRKKFDWKASDKGIRK
jgi:hypothetical protein